MAGGAVFLAGKVAEQPRHLEALCKRYYHLSMAIKAKANPRLQAPPLSKAMLYSLKQHILSAEFQILEELAFEVEVPLPYSSITETCNLLGLESAVSEKLLRIANNFANDSFRTVVPLCKPPQNLANACLFLAARYLNLEVAIQADQETVQIILQLYKTDCNN